MNITSIKESERCDEHSWWKRILLDIESVEYCWKVVYWVIDCSHIDLLLWVEWKEGLIEKKKVVNRVQLECIRRQQDKVVMYSCLWRGWLVWWIYRFWYLYRCMWCKGSEREGEWAWPMGQFFSFCFLSICFNLPWSADW